MHPNVKKSKKWAVVDNDRRLRGIYFIDPKDEEFKDIVKNAPGKLETPMPAAMPCKTPICQSSRETRRSLGKHKTKYACIVEADESMRIRLEGGPYRNHKIHIAAKGMNSLTHCNLVHKFIPLPQAMKIPDAKAAVEKEWEKLEKIPAWQLTKVSNKNEVIAEARNEGNTVHFASLIDLCHLKIYQGRVALRGDIVKDDSGSYAVFTEQGSSASQMTAAKVMNIISRLPACAGQAADAVSASTQVKLKMHHHC